MSDALRTSVPSENGASENGASDTPLPPASSTDPVVLVGPLLQRRGLWALFAALALAVPLAGHLWRERDPGLPIYGSIPAFALVDQHGGTFDASRLHGKVAVFDFVFTRCTTICPLLTQRMKTLQERMAGKGKAHRLQLVSITADPEYDLPDKLLEFASQYRVDHANWTFATGSVAAVTRTIVDGFKISVSRVPRPSGVGEPDDFEIIHGQKFVLVDRRGQIRGYYDVEEPSGLDELQRDLEKLLP